MTHGTKAPKLLGNLVSVGIVLVIAAWCFVILMFFARELVDMVSRMFA